MKWCCCFGRDTNSPSDPPLLANNNTNSNASSPAGSPAQSVTSPRGRKYVNSAVEYVSNVVNLCKLGSGSFAVVSLVIDKRVLETLGDDESSLPAFFAVKRISKRHEASRLAPGEGGAFAERHSHAKLEHPFFPVLHSASRSDHCFYIAFPFALGGDISKVLARRANCIRGFNKTAAQKLHAQATAGGTLAGMKDMVSSSQGGSLDAHQHMFGGNTTASSSSNGNGSSTSASSSSQQQKELNPTGTKENELRATTYGLPISFVCIVAFEIISAIAYLNDQGYTHYDIRPGNLLLCDGGHVILGDFGMIRDESGMNNNNQQNQQQPENDSVLSRIFRAFGGGSSSSSSNNKNSNTNTNASNISSNSHHARSGSGSMKSANSGVSLQAQNSSPTGLGASPRGDPATGNEKRSQLYLAPEHLTAASNTEAENDCKRLSDVWSFAVLLLELALGTHPFTPTQGDSAYAMLAAIRKMQFRKVPTGDVKNEKVACVIELLNDLVGEVFVPREKRLSGTSLMQHAFFASKEVRSLVGATTEEELSMSSTQFFEKFVSAKKLVGPVSLNPSKVCFRGGAPTASALRQWLSVLAPIPHTADPASFAASLDMEVIAEEDSRELIDLRFFGSLSEEDIHTWNSEDNEAALHAYDSDWSPDTMKTLRGRSTHVSHLSFGSGGAGNNMIGAGGSDHYHQDQGNGTNNKQMPMAEQPGFTFVRPNTSFGGRV